jgi:hypothetical protein
MMFHRFSQWMFQVEAMLAVFQVFLVKFHQYASVVPALPILKYYCGVNANHFFR